MEPIIRERAGAILDRLPIGETFDWVDKVSIELTTMTLATLFDFPFEERRKLTRWSDVITAPEGAPGFGTEDERQAELIECVGYFMKLWNERVNAEPKGDLISMMAHGESTRNMDPMEYPRQPHPADRRRQRHHAQHHLRLDPGAQPEPRSSTAS